MSGLLADFLGAHTARVIDQLAVLEPALADDQKGGHRQFVNSVLVALSADDLQPFLTFFDLDARKPSAIETRIDAALASLGSLSRATDTVAARVLDAGDRFELALEANADLAGLARRIAVSVVAPMAAQLTAAPPSAAHNTSLSITMHELRRPLTILNSYSQLLTAGMLGDLPESATIAIEGIASSTEAMIRMVATLAELSRLEDPDDQLLMESMPVTDIVDGAVEQVAAEADLRGVTIDRDIAITTIHGDRRRLTLALTNIMSNAVKHSADGSPVTLRIFTDDDAKTHFIVRDSGPGFDSDDAPHLFDKYYRSASERHRKEPGSGLGLYIVKTVMQKHGGSVQARSQPGQGAEFELILPASS